MSDTEVSGVEMGGAGVRAEGAVTVRVPAKVNVQLSVGAARPDGFHDLANVFLAVGLYDEITVTPADELRVTCAGPDAHQVPLDATNLAARAALALAARHGIEPRVHIHIDKDIPVAGGMAGGSADGAGALLACDALWSLGSSQAELLAICAELGSDVPFSLLGGAALGVGRGERLTPLDVGGTFHWVFAVADGGLSTPAVYAEFDRLTATAHVPAPAADGGLSTPAVYAEFDRLTATAHVPAPAADPALLAALSTGDATALSATLTNDLQPAALSLRPSLATTLATGTAAGALAALVSGSGPTTAFLTKDEESAATVAQALLASGNCRTARVTSAPAAGARVVS